MPSLYCVGSGREGERRNGGRKTEKTEKKEWKVSEEIHLQREKGREREGGKKSG